MITRASVMGGWEDEYAYWMLMHSVIKMSKTFSELKWMDDAWIVVYSDGSSVFFCERPNQPESSKTFSFKIPRDFLVRDTAKEIRDLAIEYAEEENLLEVERFEGLRSRRPLAP